MYRNPFPSARRFIIAFSAVWMLACAFGSGFLHESIGCSHDLSAETVEHQEDDTSHWAALESDLFTTSDCPVCITCKAFGADVTVPGELLDQVPVEDVREVSIVLISESCLSGENPRAPPISIS